MTMRRWAALLAIGACGVGGLAGAAAASCNVIPEAAQNFGASPEGAKIAATIPADLAYRGAVGRINGTTLVPATASAITVGPDDYCLGKSEQKLGPYRPGKPDDLQVMLLYESADAESKAVFYASETNCERIVADFPGAAAAKGRRGPGLIGCEPASEHVAILEAPKGDSYRVRIQGSRDGVPGAVSLVVLSAAKDDLRDFHLGDLMQGDCKALTTGFASDAGKLFCIDTIYDEYRSFADRCSAEPKHPSIVPANLIAVGTPNVFHEQCFGDEGSNDDLMPCRPTANSNQPPSEIAFTVDAQGGVHFPFDWEEIIKRKDGTGPVVRMVAGVTATSRKQKGEDPQVFLPGREFVGSNPLADPNGNSTDWRKPEIQILQSPNRPHESGLIGYVDKKDSIVHVYPRLPVGWVCDSPTATGEGCLGVEQQGNDGVEECAAGDRFGATCAPLLVERFFACEGGPYDGLPCTRPSHCGVQGTCTGEPKCQSKGRVWEPNPSTGSTPCQFDSQCGAGQQCGFSLFDASDRNGILYWKLEKGGNSKDRRGACKDTPKNACKSTGSGSLCGSDVCAGFHLQAMDEK